MTDIIVKTKIAVSCRSLFARIDPVLCISSVITLNVEEGI